MFVPDGFKTNAYRVLRLSANASLSEIHRAADSMRRTAKLGPVPTDEDDILLLGEAPRSEANVREAIGRLANASQRLSDRFFWFHEPRHSRNADAPARGAEAIAGIPEEANRCHDEALNRLFVTFEAGFDESGLARWVQALQAWHAVVSHDGYWAIVLDLEERGGFEPVALPSDLDALRHDAVRLAGDGLIVAGRDALARSDTATVRRILAALTNLADTGEWAAAAQEDIASPAMERLRALCQAVHEDCGAKIARDQDAAEANGRVCDAALKRFRREIEPALNRVIQMMPPDHEAAQRSREDAALCLSSIATDYTWADHFIVSEGLHEEALTLAKGTLGAIRIEHGLAQVRDGARKQRVFGYRISSAPSLSTLNGFGFKLYGNSDFDPATRSFATTYYFVALFAPVFPLARYRVIDMGRAYRFLGRLPLRKWDRWHLGIAAAAMAAMILNGIINSSQGAGSASVPSTNPRAVAPSRQSQLSKLKARIDAGRSQMSMLEVQLRPVKHEIAILETRMQALAAQLKSLDRQRSTGLEIDVDGYNATVDIYNGLLSKHQALNAANISAFKRYEDLAQQDKLLVTQYNALLR